MPALFLLTCRAELPVRTGCRAIEFLAYHPDQPLDIDDRMAAENLGQAIGQAANKAAARPFMQVQVELQGMGVFVIGMITQLNVISALACIAEQRLKKIIGPLRRKQLGQDIVRKQFFQGLIIHFFIQASPS